MNLIVQIIMETETGQRTQEVARLERQGACLENVGLTLVESKQLLATLQARMVEEQITEYLDRERRCAQCGEIRAHKGTHDLTFQTLFGNLKLKSPRWKHCDCNPHEGKTFSPLAKLLTEHVSPERLYLETKWGSLIAFEPAANLLEDREHEKPGAQAAAFCSCLLLNPVPTEGESWKTANCRKIAIVVLGQGRWSLIKLHVMKVVAAMNVATPGSFAEVDIPYE